MIWAPEPQIGTRATVKEEVSSEERDFMRAVVAGLADLDAGREVDFDEARDRLGLK